MKGVFITGTDTNVGKTIASAVLVRKFAAHYWKPVQTGLATDTGDTETVRLLAGLAPDCVHTPRYRFAAALAPADAADLENVVINRADFALPNTGGAPIVVEGAGGVLVPLCPGALMVDLMVQLGLPVVLVARTGLGTINHTLLSLEALRARRVAIFGVLLVGDGNPGNARAIAQLGGAPMLGRVPWLPTLNPAAIAQAAAAIL